MRLFYTLDGAEPIPGLCQQQDFQPRRSHLGSPGWQYVRTWQTILLRKPDNTLIRYRIAAKKAAQPNGYLPTTRHLPLRRRQISPCG